jgi:hypothetical protein
MSKIALTPSATGTGVFTISSPATNTDRTLTLPDITGTLVSTDASGNVGIGTSSPSLGSNGTGLHIKSASGDYGVLKVDSSTTSEEGWVQFSNNGVDKFRIASDSSTNLKFIHSGVAERMRIDSSGSVIFGKTVADINTEGMYFNSPYSYATFCRDQGAALYLNRTGNDGAVAEFSRQGVPVGFITITGSATTYATSSDYRLKTDAQPMDRCIRSCSCTKPS